MKIIQALKQKLSYKISLIVFLTLFFVAGPFLVLDFYNVKKDVYALNETRWDLFTEAVYRTVETVMLEGKVEIINNLLNDFRQIGEIEVLEIARMDGTRAFDTAQVKVLEADTIQRLIKGQRLNIYEEVNGKRVLTHLGLLHNTEKCQACHANDSPYRGAVVIKTSLETTESKVYSMMIRMGLMGLLVIAGLLVVIPFSIKRKIVKPVQNVLSVTGEISQGDLTKAVSITSADEMGRLAGAIEGMRKGLIGLIHKVSGSLKGVKVSIGSFVSGMGRVTEGAEKQVEDSSEIAASLHEIDATVGEITEAVSNLHEYAENTLATLLQMKASVKEIADNTASFVSFIDETSSSIEESFALTRTVNENIGQSKEAVNTTLASATQISRSVQDVRDSAKHSSTLAKEVVSNIRENGIVAITESVNGMNEIKDSADKTAKVVEGMRGSSEKIDEIVQVIREVADETKLLALNAAILSAQAGEHGKGFGVVAEEIGRLAERTAQNTKDIASIIEEIKEYINNAVGAQKKTVTLIDKGSDLITDAGVVFNGILETSTKSASQASFIEKATEEQAKAIEEISSSIEKISLGMEEILKASEQQQTGSEQILAGIDKVKDISHGLKHSTSEQSKGADLLAETGESILSQVSRVKQAMEDMKAGSIEITKRIEAINDIAKLNLELTREMTKETSKLNNAAETLESEIGRFKG